MILNSIHNEVKSVISEQFNISDLNFDDQETADCDIFNKEIFNPFEIYDKILSNDKGNVTDDEIEYLDNFNSIVKVENKDHLKSVISFYHYNYFDRSLNWLDVSDITDMSYLFYYLNFFNK